MSLDHGAPHFYMRVMSDESAMEEIPPEDYGDYEDEFVRVTKYEQLLSRARRLHGIIAEHEKTIILLEAALKEGRQELWQCYVATGADPNGADARHLNPGEALRAVREMRNDYAESEARPIPYPEAGR